MATTDKRGGRELIRTLHVGEKTKAFSAHLQEGKFIVIFYLDRNQRRFETEIYNELHMDAVNPFTPEFQAAEQAVTNYVNSRNGFV